MTSGQSNLTEEPSRHLFWYLLLVALILHIGAAGVGSLYNETDGQYAGAAKVMVQGGNWLIPENNSVPRLVKPPLLYWMMAVSMHCFGINEFAARLPGALAWVALTAITYGIGCEWAGRRRGLAAGVVLTTMLGAFTLGRIVMPEPVFAALIAGALWAFLKSENNRRVIWPLLFWACAGLAAFVKGPHGLLYPLLIALLASLFFRRNFRCVLWWPGVLVAAAINLPWYLYVESKFPGFLNNLFFSEHLGHVLGKESPATHYTNVPRWQFFLLHLAWFFPWSVVVLCVLPQALKKIPPLKEWNLPTWVIASWLVVIAGSLVLAGQRQDYYAMGLWPAFALVAAGMTERTPLRVAATVTGLLLAAALAACLMAAHLGAQTGTVAGRATAWLTVLHFGPDVWQSLSGIAVSVLTPAIACCVAAAWCRSGQRLWIAVAGVCISIGAVAGTARVAPFFSLAAAADAIVGAAGGQGVIVFDGDIDVASSLLFYTDRQIFLLNGTPDFVTRTSGIGRAHYLSTEDLKRMWRTPQKIVFITEDASLPEWKGALGTHSSPLVRCGTMVVISNAPM